MDQYQVVVAQFLERDPALFLHHNASIRLSGPVKGNSWTVDLLAIHFGEKGAYLCELELAGNLKRLLWRLEAWDGRWPLICQAIRQTSAIPDSWLIQPWLFIPEARKQALLAGLHCSQMPQPRITWLESVVPWNDNSDERTKD
jgi:hypothetical protein